MFGFYKQVLNFYKQVLNVDMTKRSFTRLPLSEEVLGQTLGGKGLGTHLLLAHNPPGVDPLSPDNRRGTAAEPMAATGFDAVMISGASDEPVWLEISPTGAVFHSASDLWGLDTFEAQTCGGSILLKPKIASKTG